MPNLPYISPELLTQYQREISSQGSPATAKRRNASLKQFLGWAHKEGYTQENLADKLTTPSYSSPPASTPVSPKKNKSRLFLNLGILGVSIILLFLLVKKLKLPIPFLPAPASETTVVTTVTTPIPTPVAEKPIDKQAIIAEIKNEVLRLVGATLDWASFENGNLLIGGAPVSSLTLSTGDTTDGDITINPDGSGIAQFLFEGTGQNFLNAQAPNLTSGSLYYGIVANNATGYDLIRLQSGSNPITRFSVDARGNTYASGDLNVAGDIQTSGIDRLTSGGALTNITGYSQTSGNFSITQGAGDFASISKKASALSDVLTLTLDERGYSNSTYSTLTLHRYDGAREAMALLVDDGNAKFDGQLRLGRFATNPDSIGTGSVVYNSTDNKIYFWNGSVWTEVGAGASLWTLTGSSLYPNLNTYNIGIGTTTAGDVISKLYVTNASTTLMGKALAIFNQTESQDIITASASSTPRFTVTNAGNITLHQASTIQSVNYVSGLDDTLSVRGNIVKVIGNAGQELISASPAEVVFNDPSNNTDLRIEGDGDANLLFADASADAIGIGTATPIGQFHVEGAQIGKALAMFNEMGDQAILTASASSAPKLTILRDGTLQFHQASSITSTTGNLTLQPAGTTTTANVQIGAGGLGSSTPDLLVIDAKDLTGDPTGTNGALYYNVADLKFRCYEGGLWKNCIGAGSSSSSWSALTDPTTNLILNHSAWTTTMNWTVTGASDPWTMNLTNNATTPTAQRFVNLVQAVSTGSDPTDSLLRLDNTDTNVSGSTVVNDAILITNSGGITSGVVDAIDASAIEIDNALNSGTNYVLFNILRAFEGTAGTLTVEDTTGNDMLQVIDQGATGRLAISDSLQVGNLTTAAYSRFGSSVQDHFGVSPVASDVLVSGKLEVRGNIFLDSVDGSGGGAFTIADYQGTGTILFPADPTISEHTLSAGNWFVDNTANVGKAALIVNQTKAGDIFTASTSTVPKFTIHNDGSFTIAGISTSTPYTNAGTIYFDIGNTDHDGVNRDDLHATVSGDLYLRGKDSLWHRIAMDMTKYASQAASIANKGYVEIFHNQNTNDISFTGWFYDTVTSLWKKIADRLKKIEHDLANEFNPEFNQKQKVTTVTLNKIQDNLGNGADGAITVSTNTSINSTSLILGRSCADGGDAVNYSITALTSTSATLESTPATGCLAAGDEVLIINLRGTNTAFGNVGNWETLRISSITTNVVNFTAAKTKYYGDGASDDTNVGFGTGNQAVILQRVPNYTAVTVNTSINFYPDDWVAPTGVANNGAGEGGVMFFRATGAVAINGTIHATGKGHLGGTVVPAAGGAPNGSGGSGGEAFCGAGGAGGSGASNGSSGAAGGGAGYENLTYQGGNGYCGGGGGTGVAGSGLGSASQGGSGGGGKVIGGGGGGGYGTYGTGGTSRGVAGNNGGPNTSGNGSVATYASGGGGGTYGDANLTDLFFGAAGGAGGDYSTADTVGSGAGGDGGGIVYIAGNSVTVSGFLQNGGNNGNAYSGTCDSAGDYTGGGGGGAGGSIKVAGNTVDFGTAKTTSSAGTGGIGCENGAAGATNAGGAGGSGRIAVSYATSIAGSTSPTYTSSSLQYNPYAIYISNEINTPGATALGNISWTENLPTNTEIELQTRTGNSNNSKDGTWEQWRPVIADTNVKSLQTANTHTDWVGSNATVAEGDVARNVDYFEDEDESNSGNLAKISATATNGYAEATITSANISTYQYIAIWLRASAPGQTVKLGFGETAGNEQEETVYIDHTNTWQKVYWDISDVTGTSRDAVTKLRVTIPTSGNSVYIDNETADKYLTTPGGSAITSTPNNYIQYRAVLTTTALASTPTLSAVRIGYTNPSGTYTIDADNIIDPNKSIENQTSRIIDPIKLDYSVYSTGTGADGAIIVSTNTSINTTSLISGRSCADGGDAVNYSVTALTSTSATVELTPSAGCLAAGDEVLLINLRGTNSAFGNVGNWEALRISSISTNVVNFTTSKTKYYGDGASDDTNVGVGTGAQAVMLQRIPNYTTVTVNGSINFYPDDWVAPTGVAANGPGEGGVMFFRATGAVAINGTIHANGKGYIGAPAYSRTDSGGDGGEAFCGTGGLGGSGDGVNGTSGAAGGGAGGENGSYSGGNGYCGGGGAGGSLALRGLGSVSQGGAGGGGKVIGGGGGGGHGTFGTGGKSRNVSTQDGANGGTTSSGNGGYGAYGGGGGGGTFGDANLTDLFFGASGGAGGDYEIGDSVAAGAGGDAGGIVYIAGDSVTVSGFLQNNGNGGVAMIGACDSAGDYTGGGGGGAGGSIKVVGSTVDFGTAKTVSSGGAGSNGCENGAVTAINAGGAGGSGIVAVYYRTSINGSTTPTYTTDTASGAFNTYKVYISKEIATTGATALGNIEWTENLPANTEIQLQTRSGNSTNSLDGTWEGWKPITSSTTLETADTHTNWVGTNATVSDGDVTRNVDYYEDEDEATAGNLTRVDVTASGGYAEATIASTNISSYRYITFWTRGNVAGNILTVSFGETTGNEQTETFVTNTIATWQKVYWDISDITGTSRDAVTKLRFTSSQSGHVFRIDNVKAESYLTTSTGDAITSTANNYIQYRAILSTTNTLNSPTLSEVRINYTNASGAQVINDRLANQNDIDQYDNDTRLNITSIDLKDYKALNITKSDYVTMSGNYNPGTGADGDVTVSVSSNINTANLIAGRSCSEGGDAVNYSVTALTSRTATLSTAPGTGCLASGDEVLLINLQGTYTTMNNAGNYETLRVEGISGTTVTFTTTKTKYYGNGATDDTNIGTAYGTQRVMLQRVPNYNNLTVNGSINFYPSDWNGSKGGVIFFRVKGAAAINGTVHANATGYIGGFGYNGVSHGTSDAGGQGGEAYCGIGGTGGFGDGYAGSAGAAGGGAGGENSSYAGGNGYCGGGGASGTSGNGLGSSSRGGSGGGGKVIGGGGGGGYGTFGYGGVYWPSSLTADNGGVNYSGNGSVAGYGGGGGGGTYGDPSITKLFFGSAGGAGGRHDGAGISPGAGGDGGGIIFISANTITVSGTLSSNAGAATSASACSGTVYAGGGGGGAGGTIKLAANEVRLGTAKTFASAGAAGLGCGGGTWGNSSNGGAGGAGRIAVYYGSSVSGVSSPAANVAMTPIYKYSVFTSDEVATPNATEYNKVSWLADQGPYGIVQVQTRSGATPNSTDNTWETWKPAVNGTNYTTLDDANTHTNWVASDTNITVADGDITRDVNFFEDEDESTVGNTTKLTIGSTANSYAENRITQTDLTNYDFISFWTYSTVAGDTVKVGFGESSSTEHETLIHVDNASTWQKVYWDISHIPSHERDAVRLLRVTAPSTSYTMYIDNFKAERLLKTQAGSTISSTPNDYIQYRVVLATSNPGYFPILYNIGVEYNDGFKVVQTDANRVRLYNYTGEAQQLRLDAVVFGADLAEWYTVDDLGIEAGDLVATTGELDEFGVPILRKTRDANDKQLIGGISTKAGKELGLEAEDRRLVALAGRIPVKIYQSSQPIRSGDGITSSSNPGRGQKANVGQFIMGKALEDWNPESGKDTIMVMVGNGISFVNPQRVEDYTIQKADALADSSYQLLDETGQVIENVGAFSEIVAANIKAGAIETSDFVAQNIKAGATETGTLIAQAAQIATASVDNLLINNGLVSPVIETSLISPLPDETDIHVQIGNSSESGKLVIEDASGSAVTSFDSEGNATLSGTLVADKIYADEIIAKNGKFGDLSSASASGITREEVEELLREAEKSQQTLSESVNANVFTATDSANLNELAVANLFVTEQTAVSSVTVLNSLSVGSDLVLSSNSVNSLSTPLQIQSLALAPIEMMAGKVRIETNGDVSIDGNLYVAGKIESSGLTLKDSGFGKLLGIQDSEGNQVASIDASGSATFSSLTTESLVIAGSQEATPSAVTNGEIVTNATAGKGLIPAGISEIVIRNIHISDYTLIYVTPMSTTQNKVLYVKSKGQGFFAVGFTDPLEIDVDFNWWVIQTSP